MLLDIFNLNNLIEVNSLPEIKSTHILDKDGYPTSDGLYSYEIFGRPGSSERKFQFAYLSLGKPFFHPVVYKALVDMDRKLAQVISGDKFVKLDKGQVVEVNEDDPDAQTGISFYYDNWEKIEFLDKGSKSRKNKISVIGDLPKNQIFVDKWIICPPFYRDIDSSKADSGIINTDELTSLYIQLIAMAKVITDSSEYFTGYITESKIQLKLYETYSYFIKQLERKNGLIHQAVMGKAVDYAVRAVISGPELKSETYKEQQIPYGYIGIPLYMVMSAFLPFVLHEMELFLGHLGKSSVINFASTDKTLTFSDENVEDFSQAKMLKLIKLYSVSHEDRLAPFIVTQDGKPLELFKQSLGRAFTLTDLFYIITERAIRGKHVFATRYPLEDYRNIAPAKIVILTTEKNIKMNLSGELNYDKYPLIIEGKEPKWVDSVRPHNSYLSGWGGDYDGRNLSSF